MGSVTTCPSCGLTAGGLRCPRCNALKVVGCSGSCLSCRKDSCDSKTGRAPSDGKESGPKDDGER